MELFPLENSHTINEQPGETYLCNAILVHERLKIRKEDKRKLVTQETCHILAHG